MMSGGSNTACASGVWGVMKMDLWQGFAVCYIVSLSGITALCQLESKSSNSNDATLNHSQESVILVLYTVQVMGVLLSPDSCNILSRLGPGCPETRICHAVCTKAFSVEGHFKQTSNYYQSITMLISRGSIKISPYCFSMSHCSTQNS